MCNARGITSSDIHNPVGYRRPLQFDQSNITALNIYRWLTPSWIPAMIASCERHIHNNCVRFEVNTIHNIGCT